MYFLIKDRQRGMWYPVRKFWTQHPLWVASFEPAREREKRHTCSVCRWVLSRTESIHCGGKELSRHAVVDPEFELHIRLVLFLKQRERQKPHIVHYCRRFWAEEQRHTWQIRLEVLSRRKKRICCRRKKESRHAFPSSKFWTGQHAPWCLSFEMARREEKPHMTKLIFVFEP